MKLADGFAQSALFRFCLVGAFGFVVDAGVLLCLTQFFAIGPGVGRVASFLVATLFTFTLHREITFRSAVPMRRYVRYVVVTAFGSLLNLGVYWVWIGATDESAAMLTVGVALGALAALGFNFLASRRFIFRAP